MVTVTQKAVLYCRVASERHKEQGYSLYSQEQRGREYAAAQGYEVEKVFTDVGSAGIDLISRLGMAALLNYLRENIGTSYVVIFDDQKRLARDVTSHIHLRSVLTNHNAKLESLNFKFDDLPARKLIEAAIVVRNELERNLAGRQMPVLEAIDDLAQEES